MVNKRGLLLVLLSLVLLLFLIGCKNKYDNNLDETEFDKCVENKNESLFEKFDFGIIVLRTKLNIARDDIEPLIERNGLLIINYSVIKNDNSSLISISVPKGSEIEWACKFEQNKKIKYVTFIFKSDLFKKNISSSTLKIAIDYCLTKYKICSSCSFNNTTLNISDLKKMGFNCKTSENSAILIYDTCGCEGTLCIPESESIYFILSDKVDGIFISKPYTLIENGTVIYPHENICLR